MYVHNDQPTMEPVVVPPSPEMANNPAMSIAQVRALVSAIIVLLGAYGIGLSDTLPAAIDGLVVAAGPMVLAFWAWWSHRKQGKQTAASVYAPSTVAKIAEEAASVAKAGGKVQIETGHPETYGSVSR